jgi:hypothetical protein
MLIEDFLLAINLERVSKGDFRIPFLNPTFFIFFIQRCQPASLRLMDNQQFKFGQSLRSGSGPFGFLLDGFKHFYLTRLKRLDPDKICVATIVMEGSVKEVAIQEEKLNSIGIQYHGIPAGENNGKRGYQLTFVIAYIRVRIFVLVLSLLRSKFHILFIRFHSKINKSLFLFLS